MGQEDRVQVLVALLSGKTVTLDVAPSDTIEDFRYNLSSKTFLPAAGSLQVLLNGKSLTSFKGVERGSTIRLSGRLCGGGGASQLKEAFRKFDKTGDGMLDFEEFLALIRKGHPGFDDAEAEALFKVVDTDLSGFIDFTEFVDYLYDNKSFQDFVTPHLSNHTEGEAKEYVMGTSARIRALASKSVKRSGGKWGDLSWKERMDKVVEMEAKYPEFSPHLSPQATGVESPQAKDKESVKEREEDKVVNSTSRRDQSSEEKVVKAKSRDQSSEEKAVEKAKSREKSKEKPATGLDLFSAAKDIVSGQAEPEEEKAPSPLKSCKGRSHTGHMMADMTQTEMVDYALSSEDLRWAGGSHRTLREMNSFKERLRTAGDPFGEIVLEKYLAKGTAGWVFKTSRKSTGEQVALKLIRLTQVLTGIKEWWVSKIMREEGLSGIVLTDETTYVLDRDLAPDMVQEVLKDAGPVPFYVCFIQEFVSGGTLEGLSRDGKLTPAMLLQSMEEVGTTLAQLHARHIQHRDIKPENVLVNMDRGTLVSTKLCDFGRVEMDASSQGRADDVRRFGVMLFSLATGEGWTSNRLIHEPHSALVDRLREVAEQSKDAVLAALPDALEKILDGGLEMDEVVAIIKDLRAR